ncbi:MAG: TldD/PmbA family protein [Chloroflexi bacterium]|uniref:TldD/PmbA family protein n=1 Tax=Candidatus Chlorohelix allophototropha TaxID=3003348 RepID=A0A8T7M2X5_9CHLR|nr:TldD/PmbA family protein [Chloroflexota bacterium]WJW66916.1 TldD/PmbA family protein [Chloroflexota bacterium L227-S17]
MPEVLGKEQLIRFLQDTLSFAHADQTEISFNGGTTALTRFANNYIHQNVQEYNTVIKVRSIFGQKVGIASGNSLKPEALKALVQNAERLAQLQVVDPNFKSLPGPELVTAVDVPEPDAATYDTDPQVRAHAAGIICRKAEERGVVASGAFRTQGFEMAVVNSLGLSNYYRGASSDIVTVVMGENSSGYAERLSPRVSEIDGETIADEAINKTLRSANPESLEPGEYEVILEEYAVREMLSYMSFLGMGAQSVQEGRSFMQLERQLMNPLVTIYDDGSDPRNIIMPFDAEGVTRRRVDMIAAGIAKAVVYDTYTANREPGKITTGHSIGTQNESGAIPLHLFMEAGDSSKEEMLKGIKRGVWVTRFHYVNPLVPDKAILTGMTRDGTFLIENGEIVRPVKNLRFTQSAVEALRDLTAITRNRILLPNFHFGSLVPAIRVGKFRFNSATEF